MAKEGFTIKINGTIIRVDNDFLCKLEHIRAKRLLNNKPIKSIRELTREMIKTNSFRLLEEELVNYDENMLSFNIGIKMDKRL